MLIVHLRLTFSYTCNLYGFSHEGIDPQVYNFGFLHGIKRPYSYSRTLVKDHLAIKTTFNAVRSAFLIAQGVASAPSV